MKELLTQPFIGYCSLYSLVLASILYTAMLSSLHCKITPKLFTAFKTSTPYVFPVTLIPQTHLTSYSIWFSFIHLTLIYWALGALGSGDPEGTKEDKAPAPPILQSNGKGRKDMASERQRAARRSNMLLQTRVRTLAFILGEMGRQWRIRTQK